MCDFSLQSVRSRPAKVGDKLVTRDFGTGTRGFAAADDPELAVCVMPGTELAFAGRNCVLCRQPAWMEEEDDSATGQQSFDRSTRTSWPHITMRSNFQMGGPSC